MEDLGLSNKPRYSLNQEQMSPIQPKTSKFCSTHFFSKLFVILCILVFLPLLPSKAPEFLNQISFFSKNWELFQLFVIGVVVCYGLFSTRNVKKVDRSVTQLSVDSSTTYLSGISHISSFFEDGFQYSYGFDEKKVVQGLNIDKSFDLDECKDYYRSLSSENGVVNPNVFDEKNVRKGLDSQCVEGNENIVAAKLEQGYRPLNLPVRSLRSRIGDNDISFEGEIGNGVGLNLKGFDGVDESKMNFRGLVPVNLLEKFNETDVVPSKVSRGSRSERMDLREVSRITDTGSTRYQTENVGGLSLGLKRSNGIEKNNKVKVRGLVSQKLEKIKVTTVVQNPVSWGSECWKMEMSDDQVGIVEPSRPPFIGETEFDCHAELVKSWVPEAPKSQLEGFKRMENLRESQLEGFKRMENLRETFPLASKPSLAPLKGKGTSRRRFSIGSSVEMDVREGSEINLKGVCNSDKEDVLCSENYTVDSLSSDVKPANIVKGVLKRGKSVRTIRSNDKFVEHRKREETYPSFSDEKDGKFCNEVESFSLLSTSRRTGARNLASETNKGDVVHLPNSRLGNNRSGDEQNNYSSSFVESENVLKKELEQVAVRSHEEENNPHILNDNSQSESDEVDKKAGEFIANFREQIRLQRVASMQRLNVGWHSSK